MSGLYPIIDVDSLAALKLPVLDYAQAILQLRPKLVQPAKHLSAVTLELLRALRPTLSSRRTLLFCELSAGPGGALRLRRVARGSGRSALQAVREVAPT